MTKTSRPDAGPVPERNESDDVDTDAFEPTAEVGSEGGSSGDVETGVDPEPAAGGEDGETWRPGDTRPKTVVRDETGRGRRSP
jgi:hypothetical protein